MTNFAFSRRGDANIGSLQVPPNTFKAVGASTGDAPGTQTTVTAALKSIATYIPTEVITLYVAAVGTIAKSATDAAKSTGVEGQKAVDLAALRLLYIGFTLATPVVVWLVFAAKVKTSGRTLPIRFRTWPIWEMVAATIAFITWAAAYPQNPFYLEKWYSPAFAGLLVLIVTGALGLVAPVVVQRLPTQ